MISYWLLVTNMSVIGITAYIMSYSVMQREGMKRSFHVTEYSRCNCRCSSPYPLSKFRQSVGHLWNL